jgi:glyoxylase-like metal-dependent hydrolase (beta-lactamase superfamily II)
MRIGDIEVSPVYDATGLTEPSRLWDRSSDEWLPHQQYLEEDGRLKLDFGAFLIRSGDSLVLVDTGYGPDPVGVVFDNGFTEHGKLPESLASQGVRPEDITHVVFTHLHSDHLGWAVIDGKPVFPNATYSCHQMDRDFFFDVESLEPGAADIHRKQMVVDQLSPLGDRFVTFDRDESLVTGVDLVLAPGHTPGSTIIVISSGADRALLLGDIVHCPVELTDPEWAMVGDVDKELALRTRESLTRELEGTSTPAAPGHLPGLAFGRVIRGEGRLQWQLV